VANIRTPFKGVFVFVRPRTPANMFANVRLFAENVRLKSSAVAKREKQIAGFLLLSDPDMSGPMQSSYC
jgi:hypothetical protein